MDWNLFGVLSSWRNEEDFVSSFLSDVGFKPTERQPFPSHLGAGLQPVDPTERTARPPFFSNGAEPGTSSLITGSSGFSDPFPFFGGRMGDTYHGPEVSMKDEESESYSRPAHSMPPDCARHQKGSEPVLRYPTENVVVSSRKRKTARYIEPASDSAVDDIDDIKILTRGLSAGQMMIMETQPPVEVRTRTPSEKRHFSCSVRLLEGYHDLDIEKVTVRLWCQLPTGHASVKQSILGGTKTVAVQADGLSVFLLSMNEASTKHQEREFCLEFIPVAKTGKQLLSYAVLSNGFYAYSHMKVLTRRKNISLRAISTNYGGVNGGQEMHLVGAPFIKGPFLMVIYRTPHGDVAAKGLELYSDSVLFFECPAYPDNEVVAGMSAGMEIKADILVTNDGRNFSNAMEFTFLAEGSYRR